MAWKKARQRGKQKRWAEGKKSSGPNREAWGEYVARTHSLREGNEHIPKGEPQSRHMREGAAYYKASETLFAKVDAYEHKLGSVAHPESVGEGLPEFYDPVDPTVRAQQRRVYWAGKDRGHSIEEYHSIILFNTSVEKTYHWFAGTNHFLEKHCIGLKKLFRSRLYKSRDEIMYSYTNGLIYWHEVTEEDLTSPPS